MMSPLSKIAALLLISVYLLMDWQPSHAQSPDGSWSKFENVSRTALSSSFPAIASDWTGRVHILWSEDIGGRSGITIINQSGQPAIDPQGNTIKLLADAGNTLFYAYWDGLSWQESKDIFFNPSGILEYPDLVVDPKGVLHAVWLSSIAENGRLSYSRVQASEAKNSNAWSPPVVLAEHILAAYYPVAITSDSKGGLYIVYSSLGAFSGLQFIHSSDGGDTWSDPVRLFSTFDPFGVEEGISPIRLKVDSKDRLHVTFSRFGKDGNGKAIYYMQSSDQGSTWSEPFVVAAWQPGWYEVDWLNTGIVKDEIHLVWEGGTLAYLNERISKDGGKTWGEAHQILPNLVGENGFAELVVDSAEQLYLLVVKRADGFILSNGIWFSHWDGLQWDFPSLLGQGNLSLYSSAKTFSEKELQYTLRGSFTGDGIRYPRAVVSGGNELFLVVVNEWGGEIFTSRAKLASPGKAPKEYPTLVASPASSIKSTPQITPIPTQRRVSQENLTVSNPGSRVFYEILLSAILSVVLVLGIAFGIQKFRK